MMQARAAYPRVIFATALSYGPMMAPGCTAASATRTPVDRPRVAPATQPAPASALALDSSQIRPLHRELLAVDLPTLIRVATAENLDIRKAREAVEASRGELESTIGAAFPVLVPTALFEHVEGSVRATEGKLVGVGFNTFQASVAVQWIINPGRVTYEILAAKKRLLATEHQEQDVLAETLRLTAVQFHELLLAQARVSAAHQAVAEAEELLRVVQLRERAGTAVPADRLRAESRLAERRGDSLSALSGFHQHSIALAVTLHLDASVTLAPRADRLTTLTLVRDDLGLDELLELAVRFNPELQGVRQIVEAAAAQRGAAWWGAFGPQFQMGYQYGGIAGHANDVIPGGGLPGNLIVNPLSPNGSFSSQPLANGLIREGILRASQRGVPRQDQTFSFSDQQRATAASGWRFSLSAFGDLKRANASERQAMLEAETQLDRVRARVVAASESARTQRALIPLAEQHVASAEESLRLSQVNLQAGTMTSLDVLVAQESVMQARFRHAEAVVRYNQEQVNLLAALGLISAEALNDGPGG